MTAIRNRIRTQPACVLRSTLALAVLALLAVTSPALAGGRPGIPPQASAFGETLAEWSAIWWKVGLEIPTDGDSPFQVGGIFPLSKSVLGLAAPLGGGTFELTIPNGKALMVAGITFECSNLEPVPFYGGTEAEQAACAKFFADHIEDMSITVDGKPVRDIASYRVMSPQFSFTVPDPNFLAVPPGPGTAVADGYYVLLPPMSKGKHTVRVQGALHFATSEGDPFDFDQDIDNVFLITAK